jgi:hypothetical protein
MRNSSDAARDAQYRRDVLTCAKREVGGLETTIGKRLANSMEDSDVDGICFASCSALNKAQCEPVCKQTYAISLYAHWPHE